MSVLHLEQSGRFSIDGNELTSGDEIEIHISEVWKDGRKIQDVWMTGRIEHIGKSYVFISPTWRRPLPLYAGMICQLFKIP